MNNASEDRRNQAASILAAGWIDSHCHVDDVQFAADIEQVLQQARAQHIHRFLLAGVNKQGWARQQQLQQQHQGISNAFGIHPWYVAEHDEADMQALAALLPQAVAVGECGLDFMPDRPDKSLQSKYFEAQIKLAIAFDLPLIIHAVKSLNEVMMLLKKYPQARGVLHGFSGSLEQAKAFAQLGFYIGIGCRVGRPQSKKLRRVAAEIPLAAMLLETDAPFGLEKGQRHTPAGLIDVAHSVASLRKQDFRTILTACSQQAEELFQL